MFSVQLINTIEGFEKSEPIWDEMVEYCEFPTIFQLHSWCKIWWSVYGKGKELYILIINRGSIPIGLAPLMLSGPAKKRSIEFIGTGNADYTDFMINPEFKKESIECILNFILQNNKIWKKISLTQMSERTANIDLLKCILSKKKYLYSLDVVEKCHVFEFYNNIDKSKKYESGLSKHKSLKKSINFFHKKGLFCYESVKDNESISKKLPELFFFHWRRWEKTLTPSKFLNSQDRDFYYGITKELCKNGNVSLEKLSLNGKSVAYVYSFLYKDAIFLYTASFDIFYRKKSPNTILLYDIIDSYIKNGYHCIDFMRGGEQYKENLTNNSYFNYELNLYKDPIEYRILDFFKRIKRNILVQKFIRNSSIKSLKFRAQSMIEEYRLSTAVKIAARSFLSKFFEYRQICVYELVNSFSDLKSSSLGINFVELFIDDADGIAGFYGAEMKSEKHEAILQRFADGSRCFALNYEGLYIALCFVQYFPFVSFNYDDRFILDKNDALLFDMCIIPEFRTEVVKDYFYSSVENNCKFDGCRCLMIIEKSEHFSCGESFPSNLIELQNFNFFNILNRISFRI